MRTLRLFALLDRLRGRSTPLSAEVLARELDVSPRTIYRDMATLQAMGAPIRGESGVGYQLEKGYFLPPLQFDPDELEAVMLGMRLVAARGDRALQAAAGRVSAKIGAVMGDDAGEHYRRLPLRAVSRHSSDEADLDGRMAILRVAIRGRQRLDIDYVDLKGADSRRTVRPLGLTIFDSVWLLTVWCETRNDFRNLRVDRIASVQEAGSRFRTEAGKRFEDYLKTLDTAGNGDR